MGNRTSISKSNGKQVRQTRSIVASLSADKELYQSCSWLVQRMQKQKQQKGVSSDCRFVYVLSHCIPDGRYEFPITRACLLNQGYDVCFTRQYLDNQTIDCDISLRCLIPDVLFILLSFMHVKECTDLVASYLYQLTPK
jgi:hypothetical protein